MVSLLRMNCRVIGCTLLFGRSTNHDLPPILFVSKKRFELALPVLVLTSVCTLASGRN